MSHQMVTADDWWKFLYQSGMVKFTEVQTEPLPTEWDGMEVRYAQEQKEFEASDEAQAATGWF